VPYAIHLKEVPVMRQSTRSSRRALKAVGSGSSVNLFSALPVGVRPLPHPHRLSKRATQRLKWLDYRKIHTVKQTCLHFDIPRSTLNRWAKRFDPDDLTTLEDRSSRPRTVRQRTWGAPELAAVLALRRQYPRWGKAKLAVLLARQGSVLALSMIGRILRYLRAPSADRTPPCPCDAACAACPSPCPTQAEGGDDPERQTGRSCGDRHDAPLSAARRRALPLLRR
jgi:hypothetical protein